MADIIRKKKNGKDLGWFFSFFAQNKKGGLFSFPSAPLYARL